MEGKLMRHVKTLVMFVIAIMLLNACAFGVSPASPSASGDGTTGPITSATSASGDSATAPTTGSSGDSGGVTAVAGGEQVTITFAATEDDRPIYEPLIQAFEAENPNIHVQFVNFDSLLKAIVAPSGSVVTNDEDSIQDIIKAADTARLSATDESIQKGWVRDMTPLMNADANFNKDDFYPGALVPLGDKQGIYMLPHTLYVPLLSYNKTLWKSHNLPDPKPDLSWDELLAVAQQLTQKNGDKVGVYGLLDWDVGMELLQHKLVAAGLDPAHMDRVDQNEVATAVDQIAELAKAGVVDVLPNQPTNPGMFQGLITESQVGIWTSNMLISSGTPSFEIGTLSFPDKVVGGDGYIMSSGTQHPEAAWRWLSFLSHKEVRQPGRSPNLIGQLPARKSVADQSGYWNQLDDATKAVINAALERSSASTTRPTGFDIRTDVLLRQALDSVIYGGSKTRDALQVAQTTLEQQIAQSPPAPTDTGSVVVVATPAPGPKPGAITINFGMPRNVVDEARRVADAFNSANPDIFIQIKDTGPDNLALSDRASNVDCFASRIPPDATSASALLDIQPLIDADAGFPVSDYPPILLTPFKYQGHLYGLPYGANLRVLNYNQSAFDAAGLSHPTASWTMDDFLNAAKTLTSGSGGNKQYGFAGAKAPDMLFFIERFGATPTTGSGDALKLNFTDSKVIQGIQFYIDLMKNYSPHTKLEGYVRGDDSNSAFPQIASGRVGMWLDFGTYFFGLNRGGYQGFTRAIAPPPLENGLVTWNDFQESGLYISAKTPQPQACWTWVKYLSGVLSGVGGAFPARFALTTSDAYTQQAPAGAPEVATAYHAAFDRLAGDDAAALAPAGIDYYWFFRAVDRALQGKDLERELTDAQSITEQYMACVKGGEQTNTCASQVDPTYNKP
jgi:ABC-type glycerol-3-phosphate transport system substrate-binding protein